jgi:hypothetical protein
VQREIERNLEDLIKAVQEERGRRLKEQTPQDPMDGPPPPPGKQPLVPPIAELRMLLNLQNRVNERTKAFDAVRKAADLSDAEKVQLQVIGDREGKVEELARKIAEKVRQDERRGR